MIRFVARLGAVVLLASAAFAATPATAGEAPPSVAFEHVNEAPSLTKGQSQNQQDPKAGSAEPEPAQTLHPKKGAGSPYNKEETKKQK